MIFFGFFSVQLSYYLLRHHKSLNSPNLNGSDTFLKQFTPWNVHSIYFNFTGIVFKQLEHLNLLQDCLSIQRNDIFSNKIKLTYKRRPHLANLLFSHNVILESIATLERPGNEKSIFQFFTDGILILAGSYFHSLLFRRRLGGKRRHLKQDIPLRGVYSLRDDPSFVQPAFLRDLCLRTRQDINVAYFSRTVF